MSTIFISIVIILFFATFILFYFIYFKFTVGINQTKLLNLLQRLSDIIISSMTSVEDVAQKVSDAIAFDLGFQAGVILLIDYEKKVLKRIAVSRTEKVKEAIRKLGFEFKGLETPLYQKENITVQVALDGVPRSSNSIYDVLKPHVTREQADFIQKIGELSSSMAFPIYARGKRIGIMIFSLSRKDRQLSKVKKTIILRALDQVGIALDNALLFESLNKTTKNLQNANVKLEEVDKLKDEFVSLASHELRTPMTVIKSYLWLMLDKNNVSALSEKQKMYIDRAYTSTQRLINLVNDMLNVSRIESGRFTLDMQSISLVELISTVYSEMLPKASEQKINLQFARPLQALPEVQADPERIEQVLINLIGNSLKFTPVNGTIRIEINYSPEKKQETVSIIDNGKGISKEDMSKLFQKFSMVGNNYLTKQNAQGTGLGLYLSKSIVELMGGKIWVESEGEGKGSKFSFTLKTD